MNHILTKRYITHNCIENCIANLCDFHQIDFRPLFLFSWDFGFKMTKSILENRIYSRSNFDINIDDYYKISKLYFNIEFIPTSNDIKKIMCLLTDGNIILINSNAYNLAWNSAYKKEYIPHSFLVAYDSFKNSLNIIDSFCSNNIIELKNLNDINIESVFIVQALGTIRNDDMSCLLKDRYIALLESNITNGVFKSIKNFSNELNNIKSIDNLTKNSNDLSNVLLLRKLSQIANGRYNTKSFFEYLCLSSGYIDAMNTIYTNWESVKNLFIKVIISQNLKLIPKIKQELHVIANLENDLCHTIIKEEKNRYANN